MEDEDLAYAGTVHAIDTNGNKEEQNRNKTAPEQINMLPP